MLSILYRNCDLDNTNFVLTKGYSIYFHIFAIYTLRKTEQNGPTDKSITFHVCINIKMSFSVPSMTPENKKIYHIKQHEMTR